MIGHDEIQSILSLAQEACPADENQVSLTAYDLALTRFSQNRIHQNVAESDATLEIKAIVGKKIGYASTNKLDEQSVRETAATALEFARLAVKNPDYVRLPGPNTNASDAAQWDDAVANCTPDQRADLVGEVIARAQKEDVKAGGSLSTMGVEHAVQNSRGVRSYYRNTSSHFVVATNKDTGWARAERHSPWLEDLGVSGAGKEAVDRCLAGQNPKAIEPGEYPVVLLPYAVEDMIGSLAWMGVSALAVQEHRSWMCDRLGQQVVCPEISLWDDARDPRGFVRPFDAEGVSSQRVDIITYGVAKGPVYDSFTAHKKGKTSTGHAVSALGSWGPWPRNLVMKPGDATIEELVKTMGRGVLVTYFHYTNMINPIETTFTGMTRDGTFWVEDGEIKYPLKNMRFTQSILGALNNVGGIGRELYRFSRILCPALYLKKFNFSGVTDF